MKLLLRLLVVGFLLLGFPQVAHASVDDFVIDSFEADYYISRDSSKVSQLRAQETIMVRFPNIDQNHGILRAIPQSYQGHSLELHVQSVTNLAGKAYTYETYTQNDNLVLKIGDPDTYSHGLTDYVITYTMRGVINKTDSGDEFYWDVNGDQWQQPFGKVEARVHVEGDVPDVLDTACFTGVVGHTQHKCEVNQAEKITTIISQPLGPTETLTIVLGFDKGTFAPYTPSAGQIAQWVGAALLFVVPPLAALWLTLHNWWRFGRDPRGRGTIVPEYLPPQNASVAMSGLVLKEQFESAAITATLLDFAVRHYVRIYEVTKKQFLGKTTGYELELIKSPGSLRAEEQKILSWFFGEAAPVGTRVQLEDLKTKLVSKLSTFGQELGDQATTAGYFIRPPHKAKMPYIIWGAVLFFAGFLGLPWSIGLILAGVVIMIGSAAMPARTAQGVVLRDYLLGMRAYMKLAEADRIKTLQSPHGELTEKIDVGNQKQLVKVYERLLPFAMLFGIEKEWIKQFEGLYTSPPDWYHSSSAFHAATFASSLSSFNAASISAFTTSGSGSGSGFSGGSSGGGGGGGGGGGW